MNKNYKIQDTSYCKKHTDYKFKDTLSNQTYTMCRYENPVRDSIIEDPKGSQLKPTCTAPKNLQRNMKCF